MLVVEETLNKTENNNKVDFSNIRDMQNLIKTKSISNFATNIKSFRQRVESLATKIGAIKGENNSKNLDTSEPVQNTESGTVVSPASSVVEKEETKPVTKVAKPESAEKITTEKVDKTEKKDVSSPVKVVNNSTKSQVSKQESVKQNQPNGNNYNRGNYNSQRQQNGVNQNQFNNKNSGQGQRNFGQNGTRAQGKFTPTGERRFDNNYSDRRQGSFGNQDGQFNKNNRNYNGSSNYQKRPMGQNGTSNGFGPRLPRPTESFNTSSLASKSNRNSSQRKKSYEKSGEEKKSLNKKALLMRGYVDENGIDESEQREQVTIKKHNKKAKEETPVKVVQKIDHAVITTDNLTVKILAETIGKSVPELMSKFLLLGMIVNINSTIDFESAELVAMEFGITLEKNVEKSFEEKLADSYSSIVDDENDLQKRPAVVCVMGHVDHGKTSLLDRIRKTNVVSGEAGGITQSIGAYTININGETITFIDTPGHEAFSAMRERGAKLTDIAILVVAADDGVMPQTIESINQIKQANVPMIVAINKIDKPGANIDNVKNQLANYDVLPEEWGGSAIMVPISAKQGLNIDKLLEMVLFVAEYQNLRANPKRKAQGSIIEARLDKGVGAVATVLVQNGTLHVGDYVVVGTCTGKIRAMLNDKRERIKSAGPSMPVQIMGLSGVPNAGDELFVVDEKMSKQVALERQNHVKAEMIKSADLSIENMMNKIADSNFKDFNVIVKADVQGSVEALKSSLSVLQNEEVKVRYISGSVGAVNENDVSLAQASNALIVAFNTKTDFKAKVLSDKYKVEIKNSKIIYEVIDYITEKINKMVAPKYKEVVTGHAEIRATFKASKVGLIAGTYVLDGKISRDNKVRVYRKDKLLFEGEIGSIQREKNEAKTVDAGFECGVTFAGFTDFTIGDTFETYRLERIN